ncbi:ATP-binding response regulator [Pontibaca salina]|uniref:histidine kinase n=1 Tax=Pontibaca salina TaxID=2795731 RepID=A0A934HLM5_9RHOB|nr:ATP-binding protein [Pontibaca salina]MBI6630484.1 response regulator [Pontibaca salina]
MIPDVIEPFLTLRASFADGLRAVRLYWLRLAVGVGIAAIFVVLAALTLLPAAPAARGAAAIGLTVGFVVALILAGTGLSRRRRRQALRLLRNLIANDTTPAFVTDEEGRIWVSNAAADAQFGDTANGSLGGALRGVFADASAVLYGLQCRAERDGTARKDVATPQGHLQLAVRSVGDQRYLWQLQLAPESTGIPRAPDSLPIAMISLSPTGVVRHLNQSARRIIGRPVKTLSDVFVSLPVQARAINTLSTASGSLDVIVADHEGADGGRELFFIPLGGPDISDCDSFWDCLPVAMIKVEPDGEIFAANKQAQRLIGRDLEPGATLEEIMQGLGRPVADWLREAIAGQATHHTEFLRLTRKDREAFVQVTLSPITEGGKPRLIAALNDATELKTLEAQFVQSQKMQAIGQLAGGVAHDFNNLLTAISGHCDLLLLRHDQRDQDYGDLVQIHENANRAAALVSQLLAFSRKQTLRPEVLDLRDTLSDLTHLLNRLVGENVTLTLDHEPVLRRIRADKRQLEQVLMNLVVNARDAMTGGGNIRIETQDVQLETPLQRDQVTVPAGEYVTVQVHDQGMGIAYDKLPKIFEPFYTTKRTGEGTGLGLPTAYGIVKQTGGFIFVDSSKGKGTVFTLYFPVHDAPEEPVVPPPVPAPATLSKPGEGVVLLVEDEAPVRAFASRALRLRGYTVFEAESAKEALRMLDEPNLVVDVFVTDVVMPVMDGPSWVRKALETRPNVRVVFVSGYAEGAFGDTYPAVPNSVFLPKPFSLDQLSETVHQQMHCMHALPDQIES